MSTGARRLLDREPFAAYLQECTQRVAEAAATVETGQHSALIFRLGAEWLALPARIFQEVAEPGIIRSLPHRRGGLLVGLAALRGELLICISLGSLLGLSAPPPAGTARRLLVADRQGQRFAFMVDEAAVVQRYHLRELREVPATLPDARMRYTTGLLPWRERLVGCLDDERIFTALQGKLA